MAVGQGPNIFSMKREKKNRQKMGGVVERGVTKKRGGRGKRRVDRDRRSWAKGVCFKLQQFCINHQENGILFHCSDLMGDSNCSNCINCHDKWEITEELVQNRFQQDRGIFWDGYSVYGLDKLLVAIIWLSKFREVQNDSRKEATNTVQSSTGDSLLDPFISHHFQGCVNLVCKGKESRVNWR